MKKTFLSILLVLFALSKTANADWIIKFKTSDGSEEKVMTITSKGDKMRVDSGDVMSTIIDLKSKTHTMLIHGQKMMMKVDQFTMRSFGALVVGSDGDGKSGKSKLAPTGEVQRVGEWECSILEFENDVQVGKFWVAKAFPNYQEIGAVFDRWGDAMGNGSLGWRPKSAEVDGMIIRSQTEIMKRGKTMIMTLISATKTEVVESIFDIPTSYKQMKAPGLPRVK